MARVVYDDRWCKIEVVPADYPGCYFVVLDNDDETAQACVGLEEALSVAEDVRLDLLEENGQYGVYST